VELEPVVHRDPADRRAPARESGEIQQKIVAWLEEMSEGLKVPFTYVQHEYSRAEMGRLLIGGSGAQLGGLAERIGAVLGLEAAPLKPSRLVSIPSGASLRDDPALAAAIGYAQFREGA
jgi:Tfp pilus assembly PilM family ATPase